MCSSHGQPVTLATRKGGGGARERERKHTSSQVLVQTREKGTQCSNSSGLCSPRYCWDSRSSYLSPFSHLSSFPLPSAVSLLPQRACRQEKSRKKHQRSFLVLIANPEHKTDANKVRDRWMADSLQSVHFKIKCLVSKNVFLTQNVDLVPVILEEIWSFQENSLLLASYILHLN